MGTQHIRRGGAYDTEATTLISSYRESLISALENEQTGFRLATVPIATGIPGDYNADNIVDAADYILYRKYLGQSVTLPNDSTAGTVTGADYDIWRAHFGQTVVGGASVAGLSEGAVPEPASVLLVCFAACLASPRRRRPARIIGH
jgi:hypothetical protein